MYLNKKAFTFIELLVVVLIIGILVAVAVPQYKKIIAKSRLVSILPLIKSIKDAEELCWLETGGYVEGCGPYWENIVQQYCVRIYDNTNLGCGKDFVVDVLGGGNERYYWYVDLYYCPAKEHTGNMQEWKSCHRTKDFTYRLYFDHSSHPGKVLCVGQSDLGKSICKEV